MISQVGVIRNVEVELQTAAKDLQEAAKGEQDKMRRYLQRQLRSAYHPDKQISPQGRAVLQVAATG